MIRPELRYLHSPDVELKEYQPTDPENFCILVQAIIGPKENRGEESFDFMVCTPRWIINELEVSETLWTPYTLYVLTYDYNIVWNEIFRLCNSIVGDTWDEVARAIGRYAKWEFEDYRSG